ncbi:mariner Mos1 transposase [Caerostris extrusa]|uniref:Mariner Mos1 transposase n=1 Tax=Caerostris extrusa TaxID=172846 RepID=A0AAV4SN60_CAEEX|nr:mariner Mos1 transposase [Caerostris extrusa]
MEGRLIIEFLPQGQTINADQYYHIVDCLRVVIKAKRLGMLSSGVILLHDNARPHTATRTIRKLVQFRWSVLEHLPYSPALSPYDFRIFGPLKKFIEG